LCFPDRAGTASSLSLSFFVGEVLQPSGCPCGRALASHQNLLSLMREVANLLRVQSMPSPVLLIRMLRSSGRKAEPGGAPLVSGLHLGVEPLTAALRPRPCNQFLIQRVVQPLNPRLSDLVIWMWCKPCRSPYRWQRLPSVCAPIRSLHRRRPAG